MKLFLISDTHAGCRNASDIFANYQGKFYKFFFEKIQEYKEKSDVHILHLGDYYQDRRHISVKSLHHNRVNFLDPLEKLNVKMYIIPGNHDVVYRSTNNFSSIEEIMGVRKNIEIIHTPRKLIFGNISVDMIPWINSENYSETFGFIENSTSDICCGHFDFAGFEMHSGIFSRHGLPLEKFDKYPWVFSGHYHKKNAKIYLGAQFEMDWSDCDEPKYFHIFDTCTRELTAIRNPYTIFRKINYSEKLSDNFDYSTVSEHFVSLNVPGDTDEDKLNSFIENLRNSGIHDLKVFINYSKEDSEDCNVELLSNRDYILSSVNSLNLKDETKDSILEKMNQLYLQAMSKDEVITD